MPAYRFYQLEDDTHHMIKVMRVRPGDTVELVDGKGTLSTAKLLNNGELEIISTTFEERRPPCILAQALPKQNKLELIIEKATELGASEFWLFPGEQSERTALSDNHRRRLDQLLISAMKQCGTLYLPTIKFPPPHQRVGKARSPPLLRLTTRRQNTHAASSHFLCRPRKRLHHK